MKTIQERIGHIAKHYGLSQNEFAKQLKTSQASFNRMINGKHNPSLGTINAILNSYPDINVEWLIQGRFPMLKSKAYVTDFKLPEVKEQVLPIVVNQNNEELIPMVPVYAHAGYGKHFEDHEFIQDLPTSFAGHFNDGTYRDFEIKGDSMEPYVFENDVVRCKYLQHHYWQNKQQLRLDETFIIITNEDVLLKKISAYDGKVFQLHSFNGYYNDYTVPAKDVKELWYVKLTMSKRKL